MATFTDRILEMAEVMDVEILRTDHTSALFKCKLISSGQEVHGIFYPKEWSLTDKQFDDFEIGELIE